MREIGILNLKVHEILQLKRNEKRGKGDQLQEEKLYNKRTDFLLKHS